MRRLHPFAVSLVLASSFVLAQQAPAPATRATAPTIDLQLVPLLDGLRAEAPGDDLRRIAETRIGKEAAKVGLDLQKLPHPYLVHDLQRGRFFYLFYKNVENAFGERPYVIQRIKKTERTWAAGATTPVVKVTWLVEAFKTAGGQLKGGSDQHFGSFSLGDAVRREIDKEYEIGFGEIAELCAGNEWPLDPKKLAVILQNYAAEAGIYDRVQFSHSRQWRLSASFDKDGKHALVCKELGIDTTQGLPAAARIAPAADPASSQWQIAPGAGLSTPALALGATKAAVKAALGEPLEDVAAGVGHRNLSFRGGLTANFDANGTLRTLFTRPGFAGRTQEGIGHGSTRAQVKQKLGVPAGADEGATRWTFPGLVVVFDSFDMVVKLVVAQKT
jgi:hypothetical protein